MAKQSRKERKQSQMAQSVADRLGISRNRDVIQALNSIEAGDRALYEKISDGQNKAHADAAAVHDRLEELTDMLGLWAQTFQKGANSNGQIPAVVDPESLNQMSITFSQAAANIRDEIASNTLNPDQIKFLLDRLVSLSHENNITGKSVESLQESLRKIEDGEKADTEALAEILDAVKDETAEQKSQLTLKSIEELMAESNALGRKLREDEEDKKRRAKVDKLKNTLSSEGGGAAGSLLGLPLLDDLKGLGSIAKTLGGFLKNLPGGAMLGKVALGAGGVALGVAVGKGIGEVVIDPLFEHMRSKDRQRTDKRIANLNKSAVALGSESEAAEEQARANLAVLENAAKSGLFGKGNERLNATQSIEGLTAFNQALAAGKSQDDALRMVQERLYALDYAKGGTNVSKIRSIKKGQAEDFKSFPQRLANFNAGNQGGMLAAALPSAATNYRDQVQASFTPGVNGGLENGLPRTTSATAETVAGKLGFGLGQDARTGDMVVDLLKSMEKFEPVTAPDPSGIPTIGYGHALFNPADVEKYANVRMTEPEAEALLREDIKKHQQGALKDLKVPVSAEQMAAMTLFAFNNGANSSGLKQIVQLTNEGKTREAGEVFLKYTKSRSRKTGELKELPGLVKRRGLESGLFLAGAQGLQTLSNPAESGTATAKAPVNQPKSAASSVSVQAASSRPASMSSGPAMAAPRGDQSGGAPGPGKTSAPTDITLAIMKNGFLDGGS